MSSAFGRTSINPTIDIDWKNIATGLQEADAKDGFYVETTLDAFANRLLNLIEEKAPKKTGKYSKSWKQRPKDKFTRQIYTPEGELFIILEFRGAQPHDIIAGAYTGKSSKKALKFKDKSGRTIFRVKVRHKGFDNIPHVRPAVERLKREMPLIARASAAVVYPKLLGIPLRNTVAQFTARIGKVSGGKIIIPRIHTPAV